MAGTAWTWAKRDVLPQPTSVFVKSYYRQTGFFSFFPWLEVSECLKMFLYKSQGCQLTKVHAGNKQYISVILFAVKNI